jgi:hypothetical protein
VSEDPVKAAANPWVQLAVAAAAGILVAVVSGQMDGSRQGSVDMQKQLADMAIEMAKMTECMSTLVKQNDQKNTKMESYEQKLGDLTERVTQLEAARGR